MKIAELGAEAEFAAGRYGLLTESWRNLFSQALNERDFGAPAQAQRVVREAYQIAETFLHEERLAAERVIAGIATEAYQTTLDEIASIDAVSFTDAALEHLRVTQSYLIDEIIAQIHRDIALLRQSLQRVVLEVSLASRSRGISQRTALIEYRIGNSVDLQFVFHDRASRRWASKKFIRALWRHTLLSVYNEMVMLTLADHGVQRSRVIAQDRASQFHDMRIAFGSNADMPTYSEIRDTVFHPNANAWLAMERADAAA